MATLITGASAGLGEAFACACAKRGEALVLVARREQRLRSLADDLRARHGVTVDIAAADLSEPDAPARLFEHLAARDITIDRLINNAGFGLAGDFADLDRDRQADMIDLNCRALVDLCHLALAGMLERRRGAILNVASTAAFQPGPWMAVYYATKAFVLHFSEALHEEVRDRGVAVVALCPGPTRTEFADIAGLGDSALFQRFASDVDSVVAAGLKALEANDAVAIAGWRNTASALGVRFAPRALVRRIAGSLQKTRR